MADAPSFLLFDFLENPEQPAQCCSGRFRDHTARQGDLVILPEWNAKTITKSNPGMLKAITGRKLSGVLKRAKVKSLAELAKLSHADLQRARG